MDCSPCFLNMKAPVFCRSGGRTACFPGTLDIVDQLFWLFVFLFQGKGKRLRRLQGTSLAMLKITNKGMTLFDCVVFCIVSALGLDVTVFVEIIHRAEVSDHACPLAHPCSAMRTGVKGFLDDEMAVCVRAFAVRDVEREI